MFIVLIIMVIMFQIFDAAENAGFIEKHSIEKKAVGWGLLALQIATVLKASTYWRKDARLKLTKTNRRKQNIGVIVVVAIFAILLIVLNAMDIGGWILAVASGGAK